MLTTNLSENHLEQMARGIKIIPRNLSFLITDMNKNLFNVNNKKEVKLNKIVKWIKSVLNLYYSNSFIDDSNIYKNNFIILFLFFSFIQNFLVFIDYNLNYFYFL